MTKSKATIVALSLLCLLGAGMLVRYLHRVPKRQYCDFRVYHRAAAVFLQRADIYADRTAEGITPFKYSPFFAFLVSPMGLLPIKTAAALFFIANFLCAVGFMWLSLRVGAGREFSPQGAAHGLPGAQPWLVAILSSLFIFRYILLVGDSGQVPIMLCLMALASAYFLFIGRDAAAGAMLAGAILFKYLPALFIPWFIVRKRYKAAFFSLLFLVLFLLLPALYAGPRAQAGYLGSWLPSIVSTSLDKLSYYDFKNQSLISMAVRALYATPYNMNLLSLPFNAALMAGYALCLALYMLALVPRRDPRIDAALLFVFFPLFNPNGWMTNFVALAFPCSLLISYLLRVRLADRFVLTCLAASFVFLTIGNQELVGDTLENFFETCSFSTLGALFMAAGLVKLKFSDPLPRR